MTRTEILKAIAEKQDLREANLSGADLRWANLSEADLSEANLSEANLRGANLREADLEKVKNFNFSILPQGEITGWKKLNDGIICELLIARDTPKICSPIGRKCRTSKALVVSLSEGAIGYSTHDPKFAYEVGKTVETELDEDFRYECRAGIHFFITKQEAIDY